MKKEAKNENPAYPMRINKYLALQGIATRKGADLLIDQKKVLINGRLAKLGDKILATDQVTLKSGGQSKKYTYLAYSKPKGVVTEEIKIKGLFPIGRLDKDSEGLIILTDDGRITDRLLNPKYDHEKEYLVTTKEKLRNNFKTKMEAGVKIENEKTRKCKVTVINENTFKITLTEGKKHQIRRMCVALFREVASLKRVRVMNVELGNLKANTSRPITGEELNIFLNSLGLA